VSTLEEIDAAIAETNAILAADPSRLGDPRLPISRLDARDFIEAQRLLFEGGDKMALMAAIRRCANCEMVLPPWVARAFIASYDQVLWCRTDSWDVAFGSPYKKGTKLPERKRRRELGPAVYLAVEKAIAAGRATDDNLFDEVGEKLGIGKTLASELYYGWRDGLQPSPVVAALLAPYKLPPSSATSRKYKRKSRK
jgi:hypothetical protein